MIKKVLCVCYGNTCRSPMLEVLLNKILLDKGCENIQVESAGVGIPAAGNNPANDHAITCMTERRLDLHDHRSRRANSLNLKEYDLIICVSKKEADQVKTLGVSKATKVIVANDDKDGIPNPWQKGLGAYQECAKILEQVAKEIVETYF